MDIEFYKALLTAYSGAILVEDEDRKLIFINENMREMFHMEQSAEKLIGTDCARAAQYTKNLFIDPSYFSHRIERLLEKQIPTEGDLLYLKDGRCLERDYRPVFHEGEYVGHVWFYRDTTEMHKLSVGDSMTGLYNRRGYELFAEQLLEIAARTNNELHVVFSDVNKLKDANDKNGHEEGDRIIKLAARTLKETLRESDVVARLGGDEFVAVIIGNLEFEGVRQRIQIKIDDLNKETPKAPTKLSMSFGFATYRKPEKLSETLERADANMYKNKKLAERSKIHSKR